MPLPPVLAIAGGRAVAKRLFGKKGGPPKKRRRRRARLSPREMAELTFIKNTLGKTAAAAALPFYMNRGG